MSNSLVEVVLPDTGYQDLLKTLGYYKYALERTKDSIRTREAQLIQYKDSESTLEIVKRYLRSLLADLERYNQEILTCKRKLKNYKMGRKLITLRSIKEELKHHTNITNISLKQRDDGEVFIEYVYHNIKCTPNAAPYLNLIDKSFNLLPVKARIFLSCNKVYLLPLYEDRDKMTEGYDSNFTVHPHVLNSSGYPCLGDFNSSFFDAISDFDLDTAVTILELFLEQADTRDDAGKFWPKFMLNNIGFSYGRYDQKFLEDQDGTNYCFYGRRRIIDHRYWYMIPIVEGGRITMLEGRKEDVLKFFENYINI